MARFQAKGPVQSPQLSLFTPVIEMDEERIVFQPPSCEPVVVHRQDVEDLWNTLRLHGTISVEDTPEPIKVDGAVRLVFDLLSQLPYIQSIDLKPIKRNAPIEGLQYTPLPQTDSVEEVEIVV